MKKNTYCIKYRNVFQEICYAWFEAINEDVAELMLYDEYDDCLKIISITKTFTWK